MLFRQLLDYESFTYTYLMASDYGREAVIIDPVKKNIHQYLKLIQELDLKLVAAIDTHLHADHITAIGELSQKTHCKSMMGKESEATYVSERFTHDDVLKFDAFEIRVIHTPGHTDDSYCFLINDRIITGDTLLIRGTGRTDFQNSNPSLQYNSLFNRLLLLPEETLVYPGHDYNGMTVSTIGEEKKFNPRLQLKSREEYITLMDSLDLSLPKQINVALPANKLCGLNFT